MRHAGTDFAAELSRLAARLPDPRVAVIAARLAAPLRVAVGGRRGVGRRTVAAALRGAGFATASRRQADVVVYVVAEVVKPEDREAVDAVRPRPLVVVLNKTDLAGGAGPAAVAARIGAPVVPMAALFAVAALGGRLDGAGWAVRRGATLAQTQTLLRRLSGIDVVAGRITAAGAAACYRRLAEAAGRLEALAVDDSRIADFLAGDDTAATRMAAAVDVVEAAGLAVDAADDAVAQLRRAVRWQRYSRGPVTALHRACGNDIVRGSLRVWAAATTPRDAA